jgi:hypothetical protein
MSFDPLATGLGAPPLASLDAWSALQAQLAQLNQSVLALQNTFIGQGSSAAVGNQIASLAAQSKAIAAAIPAVSSELASKQLPPAVSATAPTTTPAAGYSGATVAVAGGGGAVAGFLAGLLLRKGGKR